MHRLGNLDKKITYIYLNSTMWQVRKITHKVRYKRHEFYGIFSVVDDDETKAESRRVDQ